MTSATLTHIALHVRDIAACARFYEEMCGLRLVHERHDGEENRVVWLAEPGRETEQVLVLLSGGSEREPAPGDYSHLGFACGSREEVDALADRARAAGLLIWEPRDEPYPVGYYCGVIDPNGTVLEFSFGQPLGPGAPKDV